MDLIADDFHEINNVGRFNTDYILKNIFHEIDLLEFDMSNFELITSGEILPY